MSHAGQARPVPNQTREPTELLIESRHSKNPVAGSFLKAAGHRRSTGARVVLFLIDDGVQAAVGDRSQIGHASEPGMTIWADGPSLAQRGISVAELAPGVLPVDLDEVARFLFDPAVRVVWH
jgi:hypothetical protein